MCEPSGGVVPEGCMASDMVRLPLHYCATLHCNTLCLLLSVCCTRLTADGVGARGRGGRVES